MYGLEWVLLLLLLPFLPVEGVTCLYTVLYLQPLGEDVKSRDLTVHPPPTTLNIKTLYCVTVYETEFSKLGYKWQLKCWCVNCDVFSYTKSNQEVI